MSLAFWIGAVFCIGGVFFCLLGSIGVNRLPDFYTRAHAATKPDTLGVILSIIGITAFFVELGQPLLSPTIFKLLLICFFVSITNPAAAHALGRVALNNGKSPWLPQTHRGTSSSGGTSGSGVTSAPKNETTDGEKMTPAIAARSTQLPSSETEMPPTPWEPGKDINIASKPAQTFGA